MNETIRQWLLSQLGIATSVPDLEARYTRLGAARSVALEVLNERLAALALADQPGTVNVSAVVSVNYSENIKALERKIALLQSGVPLAPDETPPAEEETGSDGAFGIIQLRERPRR